MSATCHGCGATLPPDNASGRRRKWCSGRCRKKSYGDPCVDCGARTSYGAEQARIDEPRCHECAVDHYRKWTPEIVVARIREWASLHGEPPRMEDWNPYFARKRGNDAVAARFETADGHWPGFMSVVAYFGSWDKGIAAAGFEPRGMGGYRRRVAA